MCVSVFLCSRWVVKSGNVRAGSKWCCLAAAGGTSVPQQSKTALSRLRQNRANRPLWDSQEAMPSCAFELCGRVLGTFVAVAGWSKRGRGGVKVVPYALKHMPAHSESAAVIQSCTGSLHLSQGPWMASSGWQWSRETEWDASQQAPLSWTARADARAAQIHAAYQQNVNKRSQAVWEGFWETLRVSEGQLRIDVASAFPFQH